MSLLNIGITGLNAAQAGLVTTGHNISNAATPGYSRQSIVQGTQEPFFTGSGFFGQGTQVVTVKRAYSQYLENEVLTSDTRRAQLETYSAQVEQIDNLLADPDAGLSPALQSFFQGVQDLAANPSSVPARQSMISTAQALASRFQYMDQRIDEIREGTESQISGAVDEINSFARQLADLNQRIALVQASGPGQPANDLLDQRNALVAELNRQVRVSTVLESDGSLSVSIGSGQPLVTGAQYSQLEATPSDDDPRRLSIGLRMPTGGHIPMPESLIDGGVLGGLLAFRREALDTAQQQLGLVATGLAETFNAQHRLGQDLDGNLGKDFFSLPAPVVFPASSVTASIADVSQLTGSDYRVTKNGGTWSVTRLSDNTLVVDDATTLPVTFDGVSIDASALVSGQSALIQPTRYAAAGISVAISDTRLVAAAGPLRVAAGSSNTGTGTVAVDSLAGVSGFSGGTPHIGDYTLEFDATNARFDVLNSSGVSIGTVAYDPATDSAGVTRSLPSPLGDVSLALTGVPADGDAFTLGSNAGGVSDNRNAVLLGGLQLGKTLLGGTASYQSTYSQLVSQVGNKTREVQVNRDAQASLLEQATAARDSLSGVNLDEEAANLIRYQQAYQAAAKVMTIASTLFDEVLAIAR